MCDFSNRDLLPTRLDYPNTATDNKQNYFGCLRTPKVLIINQLINRRAVLYLAQPAYYALLRKQPCVSFYLIHYLA